MYQLGMGDLTLDQWKALLAAVQCPAGYSTSYLTQMAASGQITNFTTPPVATDVCLNPTGYHQSDMTYFASQTTASTEGFAMLAAAAAALFFAPGAAKLIALPLVYFGGSKALTGFSI